MFWRKAEGFVYNTELDIGAAEKLKTEYPKAWHVLGQPGSGEVFAKVDIVAKREKANFRWFGYWAVLMAFTALALASIEPMLVAPAVKAVKDGESIAGAIAIAAAIAGIVSVGIGWAGMGITDRKTAWLQQRLLAERMRQWQWQYMLAHWLEALEASNSPAAQEAFDKKRAEAFTRFQETYATQIAARLNDMLGEGAEVLAKVWISPEFQKASEDLSRELTTPPSDAGKKAALAEMFDAYRVKRFQGQLDYVGYLLGPGPFRTHAVTQRETLHGIGHLLVVAIVALHVAVITGVCTHVALLHSPIVYVLILTFALAALAIRVVEDGLRPTEQITRLKGYLDAIMSAQQRFIDGDASQKADAMRSLEEAAGLEMIQFLHASNEARFVM